MHNDIQINSNFTQFQRLCLNIYILKQLKFVDWFYLFIDIIWEVRYPIVNTLSIGYFTQVYFLFLFLFEPGITYLHCTYLVWSHLRI